jgi:Flp pilus assembly protein TadB
MKCMERWKSLKRWKQLPKALENVSRKAKAGMKTESDAFVIYTPPKLSSIYIWH